MSSASAAVAGPGNSRGRQRPFRSGDATRSSIGYVFVSGYCVLLVAFGIMPAAYAVYLSLTKQAGGFAGLANFRQVIGDYRFWPEIRHVSAFLAIWLLSLVVFVVGLALMVHYLRSRFASTTLRFLYYVPGALAGASSVLLWIFLLDPAASPIGWFLRATGQHTFVQTISPGHLPLIFAVIAFWTGAGGWIVIMYGALNNVSTDVMEAARLDGANAFQTAWFIQLPLLRKWIVYMVILSVGAGVQLFTEPQLVSQASTGVVGNDYSVNQLAYLYAFQQNNFNGSAALSVLLLLFSLGLSAVFVARGGLFDSD